MNFRKLTIAHNGRPIWINLDRVTVIVREGDNTTFLETLPGLEDSPASGISVTEEPHDILGLPITADQTTSH